MLSLQTAERPNPLPHLEAIAAIGPRPTCGASEKRAAYYAKEVMERLGLEVQEDRFSCNPRMFRPHMLVFLLVVAVGVLPSYLTSFRLGLMIAALGCLAARKFYFDLLHNKPMALAGFLPKSSCRNILGKIKPKGVVKNRIVLLSHLDSALCSPIFSEKMVKSLKSNILIDRVLFVVLALLYGAAAVTGNMYPYYAAVGLSLYMVGSILVLAYSELFSPISPGANDNGSGVAAVLSMAEHLSTTPLENTEVWCVCLGAEEPGAYGSKELWASHAEELRKSYIVNLDSIAVGSPKYLINEGYTEEYKCDGEMIGILEQLAKDRPELGLQPLEFKGWGGYTDCTHMLRNGCRAITLASSEPSGLIKNWHTLNDTIDNIQPDTLTKMMEIVCHLTATIDEEISADQDLPLCQQKTFASPGYRIIDDKMIRQSDFRLADLLWPEFDRQALYIFETAQFLDGQAKCATTKSGFLFIDDENQPVAMVPYFIYYELLDDGACSPWIRKVTRRLKERLLSYGLPLLPGLKTVFIGTPFAQPSNRIFLRAGLSLQELAQKPQFIKNYRRAIHSLQIRHFAPVVSHFNFEKSIENEVFFDSMGYKPFRSWPDMVLDFQKIRSKLKERMRENMDQALLRYSQLQKKLADLFEQEDNLFRELQEDSLIKLKAQEKHLRAEAEEKQFLLAADAQNQIDDLTSSLKTGKYIDALKKKNEVNREQREEIVANYDQLPRRIRDVIAKLADMESLAKDMVKDRNLLVKELEVNKSKVKKMIEKSLSNKFSGAMPDELGKKVEFFLEMRVELNAQREMPVGWVDITVEEALRRLDELAVTWDLAQEQNFTLEKKEELLHEIDEKRKALILQLRTFFGHDVEEKMVKLLQAERRTREIRKIEKQIVEEKRLFKKGNDELSSLKSASVEREKLKTALYNAVKRRDDAIKDLGIQGGWDSLSKSTRSNLKKLATISLEARRTDLKGALVAYEKAEQEFETFDENEDPSFEDYVESLSVSHRYAMKRNLERVRASEKDYPVEIVTDPERMLEIAYELYRAYDEQYSATVIQWLKMTADYFKLMAALPNTEVVVCWHLVDWTERRFAGFIINLDGQFNHRMGIMPEYKFQSGKADDNHLIYFRLTLRNIDSNLRSGKPRMWIAQTTYEAKTRLGFEPHVLWSYRRPSHWFGFHFFADSLYQKLLGKIPSTEDLYEY